MYNVFVKKEQAALKKSLKEKLCSLNCMQMEQLIVLLYMNVKESMKKREFTENFCHYAYCAVVFTIFLQLLTCFSYPKVVTTRKLRPLRPANSERKRAATFRTLRYLYCSKVPLSVMFLSRDTFSTGFNTRKS